MEGGIVLYEDMVLVRLFEDLYPYCITGGNVWVWVSLNGQEVVSTGYIKRLKAHDYVCTIVVLTKIMCTHLARECLFLQLC